MLILKNVSKSYPEQTTPALAHVSFSLPKGKVLGVVGESGSGKSTLLRLIAGLEDPDAGTVKLGGQLVEGPKHRLVPGHPDIRLVHQDFRLSPNIRVEENIAYALRGYDSDYRQDRLESMLVLCDLTGLRHKRPAQLSGGERQRVALACALADEPALLLLDEPFSNADPLRRVALKRDLAHIVRRSGTTAVFVTHDTADALALADQVGVLRGGRLLQLAPPTEIYNRPANPYVAALFGHANVANVNAVKTASFRPAALARFAATGILCIRAEWIRLCAASEADFVAQVSSAQYLGLHTLYELRLTDSLSLQMLAAPEATTVGAEVFVRVDWERVHGFG